MRIRWTGPASRDFTHICDYTDAHFGLDRGYKTATQILDAIDALETMPLLGHAGRKRNTRELGMAGLPFITIYRVLEDVVEILRILHGAQKWP